MMKNQQDEINRVQALYREWTQLLPQLQADLARYKRAANLVAQLEAFYTDGSYMALMEAEQQGAMFNTQTAGEYSILSEEAVFNALGDFHHITLQRLKSAVAALDSE